MLDVDWQIAVVHFFLQHHLCVLRFQALPFFFRMSFFPKEFMTLWLEKLFFYKDFFMFLSFHLRVTFRVLSLRLQL